MKNFSRAESSLPPQLRDELRQVTETALAILPGESTEIVIVIRGYLQLLSVSSKPAFIDNLRRSLAMLADLAEAKGKSEFVERLDSLIRDLS